MLGPFGKVFHLDTSQAEEPVQSGRRYMRTCQGGWNDRGVAALALRPGLHRDEKLYRKGEHIAGALPSATSRPSRPINKKLLKAGRITASRCASRRSTAGGANKVFRDAVTADPKSKARVPGLRAFPRRERREVDALKWLHELATADPSDATPGCSWTGGVEPAGVPEFACDWTGEAVRFFQLMPASPTARAACS